MTKPNRAGWPRFCWRFKPCSGQYPDLGAALVVFDDEDGSVFAAGNVCEVCAADAFQSFVQERNAVHAHEEDRTFGQDFEPDEASGHWTRMKH